MRQEGGRGQRLFARERFRRGTDCRQRPDARTIRRRGRPKQRASSTGGNESKEEQTILGVGGLTMVGAGENGVGEGVAHVLQVTGQAVVWPYSL